jgi:hypothetical protein
MRRLAHPLHRSAGSERCLCARIGFYKLSPRRTAPSEEVTVRKKLIATETDITPPDPGEWLDLEQAAEVELTSEESGFPIESALTPAGGPGWRAASSGEQLIRIVFDEPRNLRRVYLEFEETADPRTQEFVLRWSPAPGGPPREIVRQQWNFHPPDCTAQVEDYRVDLSGVRVLELAITPDAGGGPGRASLRSLRLA